MMATGVPAGSPRKIIAARGIEARKDEGHRGGAAGAHTDEAGISGTPYHDFSPEQEICRTSGNRRVIGPEVIGGAGGGYEEGHRQILPGIDIAQHAAIPREKHVISGGFERGIRSWPVVVEGFPERGRLGV